MCSAAVRRASVLRGHLVGGLTSSASQTGISSLSAVPSSSYIIDGKTVVPPSSVGLDNEALERLRAHVHERVEAGEWPHAVTIVARAGRICLLDVHPGDGEPINLERSLFRIYSQTKPIIAAATLALVDRGSLALDDELPKHLPEFKDAQSRGWPTLPVFTDGPGANMRCGSVAPTVRHLLMHSAGIMPMISPQGRPIDINGLINEVVREPGYMEAEPSERLRRLCVSLARLPLLHDPGDDFLYAIQFDVLGRVLEAVGGMPLDELLQELILQPCGMYSTFFSVPSVRRSDLMRCYVPDMAARMRLDAAERRASNRSLLADVSDQAGAFKTWTEQGLGYYGGSEGLVSSAADFYRFASMLLNRGVCVSTGRRVLSEKAVDDMTRNQVPGGGNMSKMPSAIGMGLHRSGFGLGVSVALRPSGGDKGVASFNRFGCGVGEYGWSGAANTQYFASPRDDGLLVLFLTQVLQDEHQMTTRKELRRFVYSSVVKLV